MLLRSLVFTILLFLAGFLSFAGQSVVPVLVALTIVVMPVAFAGGALVALDILGLAPPAARRAPAMMP